MPEPSGHRPWGLPDSGSMVDIRTGRRVPSADIGARVIAYSEPHRTPVLPAGWAPLTGEQQDAVLRACDSAPECLVLRIGSMLNMDAEYRVYRLTSQHWGGLWIVSRYVTARKTGSGPDGVNHQLLGLGTEGQYVIQLTCDFFNWDLEALGEQWRLAATPQPTPRDPRR